MKTPLIKITSMDARREFLNLLYDKGFRYAPYKTAQEAWDYFIGVVGPSDTEYVYWGLVKEDILITSSVSGYNILVNTPRQMFAYLAQK